MLRLNKLPCGIQSEDGQEESGDEADHHGLALNLRSERPGNEDVPAKTDQLPDRQAGGQDHGAIQFRMNRWRNCRLIRRFFGAQ